MYLCDVFSLKLDSEVVIQGKEQQGSLTDSKDLYTFLLFLDGLLVSKYISQRVAKRKWKWRHKYFKIKSVLSTLQIQFKHWLEELKCMQSFPITMTDNYYQVNIIWSIK